MMQIKMYDSKLDFDLFNFHQLDSECTRKDNNEVKTFMEHVNQ